MLSTSSLSRVNLSRLSPTPVSPTLSSRNRCRPRRRLHHSGLPSSHPSSLSFPSTLCSLNPQPLRTATLPLHVLIRTLSSRLRLVNSVPGTSSRLHISCVRSTNRRIYSTADAALRFSFQVKHRFCLGEGVFGSNMCPLPRLPFWRFPTLSRTAGRVRARNSSGNTRGTTAKGNRESTSLKWSRRWTAALFRRQRQQTTHPHWERGGAAAWTKKDKEACFFS